MKQNLFYISFLIIFSGCNFNSEINTKNIARYGDYKLSQQEFLSKMKDFEKGDSISIAKDIINDWAIRKILIEKAELNLSKTKLKKIETQVKEYKSSLLSEAYLEAVVNSRINLDIDSIEIQKFYDINKSLFTLNDDIFRFVYIELPLSFSDTYEIRSKIRRYNFKDNRFLDSISYRFKSFSLNSDEWISKNKLFEQFSFLNENSARSLKNYNFYQFKDSISLYLIKITEHIEKGDISPLEYVLPTLKYMSLNSRKKELIVNIKSEILRDALQNNKLEIF